MSNKLTKEDFINKSVEIHGNKYDYSLVNYINGNSKVKIICPIHGIFEQYVKNHIYEKCSCPKCNSINSGKPKLTLNGFIERASKVHNNKYNYSNVVYVNYHVKVAILCELHGEFKQTPDNHLHGKGCPKCRNSKGELQIIKILNENNISFVTQMKFSDCKNEKELPFDFYLPDYNLLIEYDGEQHFKPKEKFGGIGSYNKIKLNDAIKTAYCIENNIRLLRIPYYEKDINYMIMKQILN